MGTNENHKYELCEVSNIIMLSRQDIKYFEYECLLKKKKRSNSQNVYEKTQKILSITLQW